MAHQPEIILWHNLALHLELPCVKPDLTYRGEVDQTNDVDAFKESFIEAIQDAACRERARYSPKYESPQDDDVILSDEIARKITPWVRKWRAEVYKDDEVALLRTEAETEEWIEAEKVREYKRMRIQYGDDDDVFRQGGDEEEDEEVEVDIEEEEKEEKTIQEKTKRPRHTESAQKESLCSAHSSDKLKGGFKWDALCEHKTDNLEFKCGCTLPFQERTAKAFTRKRKSNDCYQFLDVNAHGFFNSEITKTLIMLGDLEPVLRTCAKPNNNIQSWNNVNNCYCCKYTEGWGMLYETAFHSYLMLNIFYCFPDLWQRSPAKIATKQRNESNSISDYRSTTSYQRMVNECIRRYTTWMCNYSHRELYQHRYFKDYNDIHNETVGDKHAALRDMRVNGLFHRFAVSAPMADDVVEAVQEVCRKNKVPEELCLTILEYSLKPKMRLAVPYDPLHPKNYDELVSYLDECWTVMVRCQVVAMELGLDLGWESMFSQRTSLW